MRKLFFRRRWLNAGFAVSLCLLFGCVESEVTQGLLLGSWEEYGGSGRESCVTYLLIGDQKVFEIFVREPLDYAPVEQLAKQNIHSGEAGDPVPVGTSYSTGWWQPGRGYRVWLRGSKSLHASGEEIPKEQRVSGRGIWYHVDFPDDGSKSVEPVKGDTVVRSYRRVEGCDEFRAEVELKFIEPPVPQVGPAS